MRRFGRRGGRDGDSVLTAQARPAIAAAGAALLATALAVTHAGALDEALFRAVHLARGDPLIAPARAVSVLCGFVPMLALVLAAAALLAARRRIADAVRLLAAFAAVRVAVGVTKVLVHRPRPPAAGRWQSVASWSFPSSHAADAMLVFAMLALLSGRGAIRPAAAIGAALLVGWTRIALGVHYPGDVLAGWGIGLLLAGLAAPVLAGPAMR